jgi:hypothetical protein
MAPQLRGHASPGHDQIGMMVLRLGDGGEAVDEGHRRYEVRERVGLDELAILDAPTVERTDSLGEVIAAEHVAHHAPGVITT